MTQTNSDPLLIAKDRARVIAFLDRRMPGWMWSEMANELEQLEDREQGEVSICIDNTGRLYLAEPSRLP